MHIKKPFALLAAIEFVLLMIAVYLGLSLSWVDLTLTLPDFAQYLPRALIFSGIILAIMFSLGVYHETATADFSAAIVRIAVSFVLAFVVLSALFYALPALIIWRSALAIGLTSGFVFVLAMHLVFLHVIDLKALKRRILVIGAGPQAARIADLERSGRAYDYVCAGFLRLPGEQGLVPARDFAPNAALPLSDMAERDNISEIVIAVQDRRNRLPLDDLVDCGFRGIAVSDFDSFWERETKRVDLDVLPRNWMLFSRSFPGGRFPRLVKRLFDIVVSLAALIALLPLLLSTALAVKIDSAGPVFYRQERVGLRERPFWLFKFRSMRTDAEKDGVPRWAADQDDRVTAVGRFIRKTRIDEIPQVLNVLRGEMSFVGPRPERPFFVEQLSQEIPFYRERFRVKPGITGWAQLNYPYGASIADARHKLEYDLYYIKNLGLMLDTIIVMQTLRVVLWPPKTS